MAKVMTMEHKVFRHSIHEVVKPSDPVARRASVKARKVTGPIASVANVAVPAGEDAVANPATDAARAAARALEIESDEVTPVMNPTNATSEGVPRAAHEG